MSTSEVRFSRILTRSFLYYHRFEYPDGDLLALAKRTELYSASDLKALSHEAAMAPLREAGAAIATIPEHRLRPLSMQDFSAALNVIRPSVQAGQVEDLKRWTLEHGSSC
jgi:SpoVK/Ycf46/Vps4 family AAA+-type ATPase